MIKESCQLEKGREVVAGILIEAIECGYDEGEMSRKLASMCRDGGVTTRPKVQAKAEWFVEFCLFPTQFLLSSIPSAGGFLFGVVS